MFVSFYHSIWKSKTKNAWMKSHLVFIMFALYESEKIPLTVAAVAVQCQELHKHCKVHAIHIRWCCEQKKNAGYSLNNYYFMALCMWRNFASFCTVVRFFFTSSLSSRHRIELSWVFHWIWAVRCNYRFAQKEILFV